MKSSDTILNNLRDLARAAVPAKGRAVLYGSRARGDARQGSDWDVLIILDKPSIEQSDYDNVAFPFTFLGWNLGEAIIPVLYTKGEWNKCSFLPFHKNVEREKIEL